MTADDLASMTTSIRLRQERAVVFPAQQATGFYDPKSQLVFRALAVKERRLDDTLIQARLTRALTLRRRLFHKQETTGYRLLNGEGDLLPGLVCDIYQDTAVVKLDGDGPSGFYDVAGIAAWLQQELHLTCVFLKNRSGSDSRGRVLLGSLPRAPVQFTENGVKFSADVVQGQKTGFFLDQRDNRKRMQPFQSGARVLNLFGYTGGFSVYAGLAGATAVTTVDVAEAALTAADVNWQLNSLAPHRHTGVAMDCFDFLDSAASSKESWDVVIVDPPSFAPNKAAVVRAQASYERLFQKAASVTSSNGVLALASCSSHIGFPQFHQICEVAISKARRTAAILGVHGQPADHPYPAACPELRKLVEYQRAFQPAVEQDAATRIGSAKLQARAARKAAAQKYLAAVQAAAARQDIEALLQQLTDAAAASLASHDLTPPAAGTRSSSGGSPIGDVPGKLVATAAALAARQLAAASNRPDHAQAFVEMLADRGLLPPQQLQRAVHAVLQAYANKGDHQGVLAAATRFYDIGSSISSSLLPPGTRPSSCTLALLLNSAAATHDADLVMGAWRSDVARAAVAAYARHGDLARAAAVAHAAAVANPRDGQQYQLLIRCCAAAGKVMPALVTMTKMRERLWQTAAPRAQAAVLRSLSRSGASPPLGAAPSSQRLLTFFDKYCTPHPKAWAALLHGLVITGDRGGRLFKTLRKAMAEPYSYMAMADFSTQQLDKARSAQRMPLLLPGLPLERQSVHGRRQVLLVLSVFNVLGAWGVTFQHDAALAAALQ
eukprot:gene4315-4568_t